eukprot:gene8142-10358_t
MGIACTRGSRLTSTDDTTPTPNSAATASVTASRLSSSSNTREAVTEAVAGVIEGTPGDRTRFTQHHDHL